MQRIGTWVRGVLFTAWNVLAVHGLFRIEDLSELREVAVTVGIALLVSWAVIRWWNARDAKPKLH